MGGVTASANCSNKEIIAQNESEKEATNDINASKKDADISDVENTISTDQETKDNANQVESTTEEKVENSTSNETNTAETSTDTETKKEDKEVSAEENLTIKNDKDLIDFDSDFAPDKLDKNHILGITSGFHIFGENVILDADTNGNIAAGNLTANVDFGTRGDSHNHTKGDVYYIENATNIHGHGFRHEKDYIVFGDGVEVEIKDGKVYANGTELTNVKPEEVKKAHGYIDIKAELNKLSEKSDEMKKEDTTKGVEIDFSDMNNQVIDISNVSADEKIIYINLDANLLNGAQPIHIKGLSTEKDGPAIVFNVGEAADGKYDVHTQIKLSYQNGEGISPGESHAHPNKILWNFGTDAKEVNFNSGHFMGSILATNGTITANVNVDGNIIGQTVHIKGGESHRWDLNHPFEEIVIPEQPTQPTNPSQPTTPEDQPTDPTTPDQPTDPSQPTTPEEQPTNPSTPDQPTNPTQPTTPEDQPTNPTTPDQPTDPSQPTTPEEQPTNPITPDQPTDPETPEYEEEAVPPLPEDVIPDEDDKNESEETVTPKSQEQTSETTTVSPKEEKTTLTNLSTNEDSSVTKSDEADLPQTGEEKVNELGIIGLTLAAMGSLFGLAQINKRKKNN